MVTDTPAQIAANAAAVQTAVINNNAMIINAFGYSINLGSVMIICVMLAMMYTFWRIQVSKRLDFADMLTKDGRKVSQTKVMQVIGGVVGSWVIIKTGMSGTLTFEIFAVYLAYVASIEGFSKFISARYNYDETSVSDAKNNDRHRDIESDSVEFDKDAVADMSKKIQAATDQSRQAVTAADHAKNSAQGVQKALKKGK